MLIAGTFALFSAAWITLSDRALLSVMPEAAQLTWMQSVKGVAFVLVASVFIYLLSRSALANAHASERRYRLLFEGNPVPCWSTDEQTGLILDVNPAFAAAFGYAPGLIRGHPADDLIVGGLPADMVTEAQVWLLKRADGRIVRVLGWSQAVETGQGHVRLVTLVDLGRSLPEAEAGEAAQADAARATRELQQLSNAAAHDLQEPVRQVVSFSQLLQRRFAEQVGAEGQEYLGFIVEGALRLRTLMADVLALTCLEREPPSPVALGPLVQQLLDRVIAEHPTAQAQADPLPVVPGSAHQLHLLFQHLIDNAVKFHAADRPLRLWVACQEEVDGWVIRVRDNGQGIPPDSLDAVFRVFFRLHSRTQAPGNGIGLALCRKVAELHGGRLWAETGVPDGTTLTLFLPRTPPLARRSQDAGLKA